MLPVYFGVITFERKPSPRRIPISLLSELRREHVLARMQDERLYDEFRQKYNLAFWYCKGQHGKMQVIFRQAGNDKRSPRQFADYFNSISPALDQRLQRLFSEELQLILPVGKEVRQGKLALEIAKAEPFLTSIQAELVADPRCCHTGCDGCLAGIKNRTPEMHTDSRDFLRHFRTEIGLPQPKNP